MATKQKPSYQIVWLELPSLLAKQPARGIACGLARQTSTQLVVIQAEVVERRKSCQIRASEAHPIRLERKTGLRVGLKGVQTWRSTRQPTGLQVPASIQSAFDAASAA